MGIYPLGITDKQAALCSQLQLWAVGACQHTKWDGSLPSLTHTSLWGWGLNPPSCYECYETKVQPSLMSMQLEWTKSKQRRCCLNWQQPERSANRGAPALSTHFRPHARLVGNISGEDVRNQSLPKALVTSRDCWRIHFDSWMWQSPLEQKLQEKRADFERLTKSAPLPASYRFWKKLDNLPRKQNATAHVYSAESAPQHQTKILWLLHLRHR